MKYWYFVKWLIVNLDKELLVYFGGVLVTGAGIILGDQYLAIGGSLLMIFFFVKWFIVDQIRYSYEKYQQEQQKALGEIVQFEKREADSQRII